MATPGHDSESADPGSGAVERAPITNCHVHTFTSKHTPSRYLPWPLGDLARIALVRRALVAVIRVLERIKKTRLGRYAEILETAYLESQEEVFRKVQSFYPRETRFVVLPMDMAHMKAGRVKESIDLQHEELARLWAKDVVTKKLLIPFAAVDPRDPNVCDKTISLLERGFRGLKLYPPTGYHPDDPGLRELYTYAADRGIPVMTHCQRPEHVQYRKKPTAAMQKNPETGQPFNLGRYKLLERFTDPDSYRPILERHPELRICLAHFGGPKDWELFLQHPWTDDPAKESWLTKIVRMIRDPELPNVWTDISYTVFCDDEYVYLLKVLLSDPAVSARVLFGSDFYVVANAGLEERHRSVRVRAVLGEELFDRIARENPIHYLGERSLPPA